jgi:uncharacterized protein (DUF1778 family)
MVEERSERLAVRLAPTEARMLDAMADAKGISLSDVVRMLIREGYAAQFGAGTRPPKKKPAK